MSRRLETHNMSDDHKTDIKKESSISNELFVSDLLQMINSGTMGDENGAVAEEPVIKKESSTSQEPLKEDHEKMLDPGIMCGEALVEEPAGSSLKQLLIYSFITILRTILHPSDTGDYHRMSLILVLAPLLFNVLRASNGGVFPLEKNTKTYRPTFHKYLSTVSMCMNGSLTSHVKFQLRYLKTIIVFGLLISLMLPNPLEGGKIAAYQK